MKTEKSKSLFVYHVSVLVTMEPVEEWQCGHPYCQHPGCWLASRDKSVEIPPLNRSIVDAIEKTKKSTHVTRASPVECEKLCIMIIVLEC